MQTRPTNCAICGKPLVQPTTGRPRMYCSRPCQVEAGVRQRRERIANPQPSFEERLNALINEAVMLSFALQYPKGVDEMTEVHLEFMRQSERTLVNAVRAFTASWTANGIPFDFETLRMALEFVVRGSGPYAAMAQIKVARPS